ncbi:DegT/DnrJ/EryC1/StrS family aminotransferase [Notoacmeibacter ruber]|uniref:DegT/DnrJ/EryC1/StrS aminotransferase family protein n=1 Tax=Notoacmeibacter ruber TaxID=2670375 RepID=A0A3L7JFC3_9HYPH|nr:DegT/DnrJ/EryC1/StrS aminotransferase family protein [Notoacmeibacter ruber]RLQ88281.1 DegT/DnrJ/EryC1/StrS aminotransferase family protein [Notoacmeibacter ruber]
MADHAPWPNFTDEEAEAVSRVLLSNKVNYWTGQECRHFEKEFATFAGTDHAIAVANGTVALDLALHGLKIGAANGGDAGDEVIVTPRSFIASVSCVIQAGARPVFADVGEESGNLEPETIAAALSPRTRAVLCVHLGGLPCDMDAIRQTVGADVFLIEDCAQAHGALYKGTPVGSLGDVAAWSFCQDKIMTTGGEGGMVTCHDETLWRRMWSYKDHGKSYAAVYEHDHPPGFRWLHESIGMNGRMIEMEAAIGRIQLQRMESWHAERAENARQLHEALLPYSGPEGFIRLPQPVYLGATQEADQANSYRHAWYRFIAFVRPERLPASSDRDAILRHLQQQGVACMQGSCSEIYLEKAFDGLGCRPLERLPVARQLGETSLTFLIHPGLTIPSFNLSAERLSDASIC